MLEKVTLQNELYNIFRLLLKARVLCVRTCVWGKRLVCGVTISHLIGDLKAWRNGILAESLLQEK